MNKDKLEEWTICEIESIAPPSAKGATRSFQRVLIRGNLPSARKILTIKIRRSVTDNARVLWFGVDLPDPEENIGHWRYPLPEINQVTMRDDWMLFAEHGIPKFYTDVIH